MDITRLLRATQRYTRVPRSIPRVIPCGFNPAWTVFTGQRHMYAESSPPLQAFASGGHLEGSAAYVLWPPSSWLNGSAEERAAYFYGLQKDAELGTDDRVSTGQQAATLLDLMTIRAYHSTTLRRYSLGTALGFRTRQGVLTSIPAIIVFVVRKVHRQWLHDEQKLPSLLEVCNAFRLLASDHNRGSVHKQADHRNPYHFPNGCVYNPNLTAAKQTWIASS